MIHKSNGPGDKKIKSDKSGVIVKKRKKHNVTVSKRTKTAEAQRGTYGRMQANREADMKKRIKSAGGLNNYLKGVSAAQKRVKKNPPRKINK